MSFVMNNDNYKIIFLYGQIVRGLGTENNIKYTNNIDKIQSVRL